MSMSEKITSYHNFAYYYNKLIPLDFYLQYQELINKYGVFSNVLDLGCGSGTLCFLLKNDFNEVFGLDLSQEMLMIAQDENMKAKKGVHFINQDFNDLQLNENSYDLIVSTLDSLNYIETASFKKVVEKVSSSLVVDGFFIFDVITKFYSDEIVNDHYQSEAFAEFEYDWSVNKVANSIIKHELTISDYQDCYYETHYQYIHNEKLIIEQLASNNLEVIETIEETNELNTAEASRVYYVCQRREK